MTDNTAAIDRNLALEAVRVTEAAALAASRLMGRGDEKAADEAAARAMHNALRSLAIDGTVRIGEGAKDEAGKLYVGEKVGTGLGPKVDVALRPLEGISIIARGGHNALSVIAMAEDGGFLAVPGIYMDKIAVGGGLPDGIVDLDQEPAKNLKALAKARGVAVGDLVVCILDRPRHAQLIAKVREAGARIRLILDGDVSGAVATTRPDSGVDIYMGIGGAPQGVLAAAALACAGGQMQGRLVFRSDADRAAARAAGIDEPERKYTVADMASGNVTFAATGVTGGPLLQGVRRSNHGLVTHSLVMRSKTGTLRYVEAHHDFSRLAAAGMDKG
jgi:fructose-1,6-bisphosphatase II / sedoheptulose-1,7-bisphosphatase